MDIYNFVYFLLVAIYEFPGSTTLYVGCYVANKWVGERRGGLFFSFYFLTIIRGIKTFSRAVFFFSSF